jgi:hypothetical protein
LLLLSLLEVAVVSCKVPAALNAIVRVDIQSISKL